MHENAPLTTVALAIGSNLGDRARNLREAVRRLVAGGVQVDAVSSLYETPPWGYEEQPPFLNGAVCGRTALDPQQLLALAKRIESELGRAPSFRNAPRPVDIDIALYGDRVIAEPGLHVPHPGLPERAFVLVPLAEIAGSWVHPTLDRTIADVRAALGPADEVKPFLPPARWAYITPEMERSTPAPEISIDSSTHPHYSVRILALHTESEYQAEMRRLGIGEHDARYVQRAGYAVAQIADMDRHLAESVADIVNGFGKTAHGAMGDVAAAMSDEQHRVLVVRGTLLGLVGIGDVLEHRAIDLKPDSGKERTEALRTVGQALRLAIQRHENPPATVQVSGHLFDWANRVIVMGILNATPDSFSDAGKYFQFDDAVRRANEMADSGATMIEVGGQSARPGALISVDEELSRIAPLLERLRAEIGLPLAVDTFRVEVARGATAAGASYINDIGGGEDDGMARLAAETGALLGIMHLRGRPKEKQWDTTYESVMDEVTGFLHARIGRAVRAGVRREKIVIDPGLGFGKEAPQDLEVMHRFAELRSFGLPILLATSRKNYLSDTVGGAAHDLMPETAAAVAYGIAQGANIIRVHDVDVMARIARVMPHLLRHTP